MHGLGHINHVATNMLINEIKFVFRLKMWLVFIKITTILKHKLHFIKAKYTCFFYVNSIKKKSPHP